MLMRLLITAAAEHGEIPTEKLRHYSAAYPSYVCCTYLTCPLQDSAAQLLLCCQEACPAQVRC
jgi:hypothetical protein